MASIDTVKNELGINPLANTNVDNVVSDTSTAISQSFASLMALLNSNNGGSSADNHSTATHPDSNALLKGIQSSLLSAIGLNNLDQDNIAQLTSESSLSTMQASLLSSLQNSLFSTPSATAQTDDTAEVADVTVESYLQDAYHYAFGENGACINNIFDSVNPLNHIPVIADEYQAASSTVVSPISDILGGYAYGGPIGASLAAANLAIESLTGKSIYNNVKDYFFNDTQQAVAESVTAKVNETLSQTSKAHHFVTRAI